MSLIDQAKTYAAAQHEQAGQLYDGKPYLSHLHQVAKWVDEFHERLNPFQWQAAMAGAYCHDLIEDCRVTYNDVKAATSAEVAEIAYLLATPKGRNRAARHCDAYYQEMAGNRLATLVKICDRLANVAHSRQTGGRMLALYQQEQAHFAKFLRPAWPEFDDPTGPWGRLDMLLDDSLYAED